MSQTPARPARNEKRARMMAMFNPVVRFLLSLPFATPISKQLMLLTYRGRRSGKTYRQPVSVVAVGDTMLTPGGGRWKLNLREGEPIQVRLAGRNRWARPEFVRDRNEIELLLRTMMQVSKRLASFVPVMAEDGTIDGAKLDNAVRYGFVIVRWRFDDVDR